MLEYPIYLRIATEHEAPHFQRPSCAESVIATLIQVQRQGWLRLHGFVLLPNALEMVASLLRQGPAGTVAHLQAESIPPLSVLLPGAGMIWSQTFHYTELRSQWSLDARLEILSLTPVAAGITRSAAEYPYSAANSRFRSFTSDYAGFRMNGGGMDEPAGEAPTQLNSSDPGDTTASVRVAHIESADEIEATTRLVPPVTDADGDTQNTDALEGDTAPPASDRAGA